MTAEWISAAAILAAPFIVFGLIELISLIRRRRWEALARRRKDGRRAAGGLFGRPRRR